VAARSDNWTVKSSKDGSALTGKGIVVDIGTGDGRFVFRSAAANPEKFYIGIDANPKPLRKISMKAERSFEKKGGSNVMYVQAAVEDLPEELDGVADEVHIHYPWGSLLRAVLLPDKNILGSLRRICSPGAFLEVVTGFDEKRDKSEKERLGLTATEPGEFVRRLAGDYLECGFRLTESRSLSPSQARRIESNWARKLDRSMNRKLFIMVFEAV